MSRDLFSRTGLPAPQVKVLQSTGALSRGPESGRPDAGETKRHRDLEAQALEAQVRALAARRDAAHQCRVCGLYGAFGFGGPAFKGTPYRWACDEHKAEVERMTS